MDVRDGSLGLKTGGSNGFYFCSTTESLLLLPCYYFLPTYKRSGLMCRVIP